MAGQSDVRELADVRGLATLAEAVPDMVTVLAVAATESIRRAAQLVHMHHNTVAQRVRDAERALGYPLTEPYGRTRLMVGLILYRPGPLYVVPPRNITQRQLRTLDPDGPVYLDENSRGDPAIHRAVLEAN